jgi:transposase
MADSTREMMRLLLFCIQLLLEKFGATSRNSSVPPSQDPNRQRGPGRKRKKKKSPGGQSGHKGSTLRQVEDPDEVITIGIDKRTLPKGVRFSRETSERRQVFDIVLEMIVKEYQAEVLTDSDGNRYVAPFPDGVNSPVQYGHTVKGLALYLSNYQMLPWERLEDFFRSHFGVGISKATLCNIRSGVSKHLDKFRQAAVISLLKSTVLYGDETGINIAGKNRWLHCVSSDSWTLLIPHDKRGKDAPVSIGVLPEYQGILMHDNWSPYYQFECEHALCNAHQVRELTRLEEEDVRWALAMKNFLLELRKEVEESGGLLSERKQNNRRKQYRSILKEAEAETPKPEPPKEKKRGRQKKSRDRNLLERLVARESETLLFMTRVEVPFTNNQGERDQRMTKVRMKVSGSYKTLETATDDALLRSFISSCLKQGVSVSTALNDLARGILPSFVTSVLSET